MVEDPYEDRQRLTFEQAEGAEPLPTQLKPKQMTQKLRSRLWTVVLKFLVSGTKVDQYSGNRRFVPRLETILEDYYVLHKDRMIDDLPRGTVEVTADIRALVTGGSYVAILGFLQFVLRHASAPPEFATAVDEALKDGFAAYRVFDGRTIIPIASEEDAATLRRAFADLGAAELHGARNHLCKAGEHLSAGQWADSIRESIHAVESVARMISPSGALKDALNKLEQSVGLHGALKSGFLAIYGYTSDEKGIRHALLDEGQAKADETDALFMIGACAAFVSYMVSKARSAGVLKSATPSE